MRSEAGKNGKILPNQISAKLVDSYLRRSVALQAKGTKLLKGFSLKTFLNVFHLISVGCYITLNGEKDLT